MSATGPEGDLKVLQHRAEQAILSSLPRDHIVRLLEEILARADEASDASRFAHRHLAEIHLEESPWAAALHLRRILSLSPDDDTAHALMGLCQALQGNFRMAVAAYRRALSITPTNPWYNHNLGHLLDVALGAPAEAIIYLRKAHRAQPGQEEVGASLAHCLGRLGQCTEALSVTRTLLLRHPDHQDLRCLLDWLEQGAPSKTGLGKGRRGPVGLPSIRAIPTRAGRKRASAPASSPDEEALISQLRRAGATEGEIARAVMIWRDFVTTTRARMCAVTAATIDYALTRIDGAAARQREVAERHGVSVNKLATRFRELKGALNLAPRDVRYQ